MIIKYVTEQRILNIWWSGQKKLGTKLCLYATFLEVSQVKFFDGYGSRIIRVVLATESYPPSNEDCLNSNETWAVGGKLTIKE